jgi:hypothetical protein
MEKEMKTEIGLFVLPVLEEDTKEKDNESNNPNEQLTLSNHEETTNTNANTDTNNDDISTSTCRTEGDSLSDGEMKMFLHKSIEENFCWCNHSARKVRLFGLKVENNRHNRDIILYTASVYHRCE